MERGGDLRVKNHLFFWRHPCGMRSEPRSETAEGAAMPEGGGPAADVEGSATGAGVQQVLAKNRSLGIS